MKHNTPSIDLGDDANKIAFQVTSTSSLAKTTKTVTSFNNRDLHKVYDRLVILNINKKAKHTADAIGDPDKCVLNTKDDIWDISDLLLVITNLATPRLIEISDFLNLEVKFGSDQSLAKELKTFISLITYLSDEKQPSAGNGFIEAPDPEGKILRRFSEHSTFLQDEYKRLFTEYGQVLQDVTDYVDIGTVRVRRLGNHLRKSSDDVLSDCGGNAVKALEQLVNRYSEVLAKANSEYDQGAVRFFLVDQLIRCNVFPNKEVVGA